MGETKGVFKLINKVLYTLLMQSRVRSEDLEAVRVVCVVELR